MRTHLNDVDKDEANSVHDAHTSSSKASKVVKEITASRSEAANAQDSNVSSSWDFTTVFDFLENVRDRNALETYPIDHSIGISNATSKNDTPSVNGDQHLRNSIALKEVDAGKKALMGLGNFAELWEHVRPRESELLEYADSGTLQAEVKAFLPKEALVYTSDGALYYPASAKQIWPWNGEADNKDDMRADTQPDSPDEQPVNRSSKAQRRARKKKAKRAELLDRPQSRQQHSPADAPNSGDDTDYYSAKQSDNFFAAKKSTQATPVPVRDGLNKPELLNNPFSVLSSSAEHADAEHGWKKMENVKMTLRPTQVAPSKPVPRGPDVTKQQAVATKKTPKHSHATSVGDAKLHASVISNAGSLAVSKASMPTPPNKPQWPVADPYAARLQGPRPALPSYSSQVASNITKSAYNGGLGTVNIPYTPPPTQRPQKASQVQHQHQQQVYSSQPLSIKKAHPLAPLQHLSSNDRYWSLLIKLKRHFSEDEKFLLSPFYMSPKDPDRDGIHVFVDASNILIGFQEHLKAIRGIPSATRVPRVDLDFHALALLLERRRPTARKVLVSSKPDIPAFDEARQVGYETSILTKVQKVKEITERQKFFSNPNTPSKNNNIKNNAITDSGKKRSSRYYESGDESFAALESMFGYDPGAGYSSAGNALTPAVAHNPSTNTRHAPSFLQGMHWHEQGVDELLHYKMLESIIDRDFSPGELMLETQHNRTPGEFGLSSGGGRPVMIVATGDAAEAEYTSGFLAQIKRALFKGWNVEVVAWSSSISGAYRRLQRDADMIAADRGERRFRIIELDPFVEELFGNALDFPGLAASGQSVLPPGEYSS